MAYITRKNSYKTLKCIDNEGVLNLTLNKHYKGTVLFRQIVGHLGVYHYPKYFVVKDDKGYNKSYKIERFKEVNIIESFINRLKKIGIQVTLFRNVPWVYLDTVNGKKVKGTFKAEHGFTAFFEPVRADSKTHITDIREVFKKIRETLND